MVAHEDQYSIARNSSFSFDRAAAFVQAKGSEPHELRIPARPNRRRTSVAAITDSAGFREPGCASERFTRMSSVILLLSLLTPNNLEQYASELLVPEHGEPRCDAIDRMLAKYDAEYELELAIALASDPF
jgi:hypothetical protein